MIEVRYAKLEEYELVLAAAPKISLDEWKRLTDRKQAVIAFLNNEFAGWLAYDYYNSATPLVNEIFVFEHCRRQAVGSFLLLYCEDSVRNLGYKHIMLSFKEENTEAAAFYKKLGYGVLGSFDYFAEHRELMLGKELRLPVCCGHKND